MDDQKLTPEQEKTWKANAQKVYADVVRHAYEQKKLTAFDLARWHGELMAGLDHGPDGYLGTYRGNGLLRYCEVTFGGRHGAAASNVTFLVRELLDQIRAKIGALEAELDPNKKSKEEIRRVAELAAWAHTEWVRIHPFANGSGRTARLLLNWVLMRLGMDWAVDLRPRPDNPYEARVEEGLRGNHATFATFILDKLNHLAKRRAAEKAAAEAAKKKNPADPRAKTE